MDRGDIVAGSKPTRKPQEKSQGVIVDNPSKPIGGSTGPSKGPSQSAPGSVGQHCGAMSQQRCDSGSTSTPQQFVHLVGCRDRKTGQQQR